jgi:hypothetical protein
MSEPCPEDGILRRLANGVLKLDLGSFEISFCDGCSASLIEAEDF